MNGAFPQFKKNSVYFWQSLELHGELWVKLLLMLQIFKSTIRTFKSDKSLITKYYLYVTVGALYNNIIFTYCRMYCMTISLYNFEDALYD